VAGRDEVPVHVDPAGVAGGLGRRLYGRRDGWESRAGSDSRKAGQQAAARDAAHAGCV